MTNGPERLGAAGLRPAGRARRDAAVGATGTGM